MPTFGKTSSARLDTCDERLQRLFREVVKHRDCTVLCGHRTKAEQDAAFLAGKSKTAWPRSNHNNSPSRAVDVMPWHDVRPNVRWDDLDGLREFAGFVLGVASQMGINVRWGGHFRGFFDGPHWELID